MVMKPLTEQRKHLKVTPGNKLTLKYLNLELNMT